jgi:hypothetical protein
MNNDRINAALAISEKYGAVVRREAVTSMPRVCAKNNRHYAALYITLPNGRYRFRECVPAIAGPAGKGELQNIDLSQIDSAWLNKEKCLWCGSGSLVRCGNCNQYVCAGRTDGEAFKCCRACGFEGVISGTYSSFTGSKQSSRPTLKAPSSAPGALRAPVGNGLMLTTGGKK